MRLRLFLCVLALSCIGWAGTFDQPLSKKVVDLGRSESSPGRRAKVTCYFFPHFMVKEVDLGEKGSDRLAIVPVVKGKPTKCTKSQDPVEKVVKAITTASRTGKIGDGKIFLSRIDDAIRIRNEERGDGAL